MPGHRKPDLVDIAADHPTGLCSQYGQFGADRAGDVVHRPVGQPSGPVGSHRYGGRLLEGFGGEQPLAGAGQFGGGSSTQQGGFDHDRRSRATPRPQVGNIGDPARVGKRQPVGVGQRLATVLAGQVGDVVEGETQPGGQLGLTPVTITL
jgi:hypothetical protein